MALISNRFLREGRSLPPELEEQRLRIQGIARDKYKLDFFETIFEMCTYEEINMIASYGGFPTRYPHWRFGMEYLQMQKSYEYGLSKIYEMVINTDPSYAYLLDNNLMVDQKLVMAHVFGHVDFFKNNLWFRHTNRKMLDTMANHATRIRQHADKYGVEEVERFMDICLSLDNLIDVYSPHIRRRRPITEDDIERAEFDGHVPKIPAKGYMDKHVNPPDYLKQQKQRKADDLRKMKSFPEEPVRDVLSFMLQHAKLKKWQRDVLKIVRDEAYYFAPQGQTKIMNEGWACVAPDTLVFTDAGLVTMAALVHERVGVVADGDRPRRVYDYNVVGERPTVTIRTRRGFVLTGSDNHRVMRPDGSWVRLDELAVGTELRVAAGQGLWPTDEVPVPFEAPAGVSLSAVLRYRDGRRVRSAIGIADALEDHESEVNQARSQAEYERMEIRVPTHVDERFGAFLGHLVGNGHISQVKRTLGLTTGDESQAHAFAQLLRDLFGAPARIHRDGERLRVLTSRQRLNALLVEHLGLTPGPSDAVKQVPDCILRSPERVVAAFLRALFDADGDAGKQGVLLSSMSSRMTEQVQLLLLNWGILGRRRQQADGGWHLHVTGALAKRFEQEIGFGIQRKRDRLAAYVSKEQSFGVERWTDEVESIEHGRGVVYDISVQETHRYAAAGLVNHNSYWHTTMMANDILDDSEVIDYADHHSGTVYMKPGSLNPYKLGIELYRHIEERWNKGQFGKDWLDCADPRERAKWDTGAGLGRDKIFEVRRTHNDVTFLDTFLTAEFCRDQGFFTTKYDPKSRQWLIDSREFAAVKQQLLTMLSLRGTPVVHIVDANAFGKGELRLVHQHEGLDIQLDWASVTLENLQHMWGNTVHLETKLDGKPIRITHDGSEVRREVIKPTDANPED